MGYHLCDPLCGSTAPLTLAKHVTANDVLQVNTRCNILRSGRLRLRHRPVLLDLPYRCTRTYSTDMLEGTDMYIARFLQRCIAQASAVLCAYRHILDDQPYVSGTLKTTNQGLRHTIHWALACTAQQTGLALINISNLAAETRGPLQCHCRGACVPFTSVAAEGGISTCKKGLLPVLLIAVYAF